MKAIMNLQILLAIHVHGTNIIVNLVEVGTLQLSTPPMSVLNVVAELVSTVAPQPQIKPATLVNGIGATQKAVDLTTMKTSKQMRCAALAKVKEHMTGVEVQQTVTMMAAPGTLKILVHAVITMMKTSLQTLCVVLVSTEQ